MTADQSTAGPSVQPRGARVEAARTGGTRSSGPAASRERPPAAFRTVGLIATREIRTRIRSKAYIVSTIVLAAILIVLALLNHFVGGDSAYKVGFTPGSAALSGPLVAGAKTVGDKVSASTVADEVTGRAEVRSGKLDALVVGDGTHVTVIIKRDLDGGLKNALQVLASNVEFAHQITALGGDPAKVAGAASAAHVTVVPLEPPHTYDTAHLVVGVITGILIYLALMISGQAVAQGVVEEKSSRVVELLLATVRPWQLMAGKVLGIGAVSLLQVFILGVIGAGVGVATGALSISAGAAAGTVVWLVVWFVLGYLAYAFAFAAAAALVSRQEDVASVVTPVLTLVIVGYILGISILPSDPSNGLLEVMSMIPVFAPTLMPMRLAMGGVPPWEAAVAVAGMIVIIPALVVLAARIYRNAIVRSGARVGLRDAWRA